MTAQYKITELRWDIIASRAAVNQVQGWGGFSRPMRRLNEDELNELLKYLRQKVVYAVGLVRMHEPPYAGYDQPAEQRVRLLALSGNKELGVVYGTGRVTGVDGKELHAADA